MDRFLARSKSSSSLRRQALEAGSVHSTTLSEPKSNEPKPVQYNDPRYTRYLTIAGVYMDEDVLGIGVTSTKMCVTLLTAEQDVAENSLFQKDRFRKMCRKLQGRNEARVTRDIGLLIVPSAETLATYGAAHLECLIESTNEGWNNSIPIVGSRPQPDYSVGFSCEAFTSDQLQRLQPLVGNPTDTSLFMATYYMYFPFLMSEVKRGAADLDGADRQNAHSAAISLRAIVELFTLVGREQELNREILAFSISHDHRNVRIYGYYPLVKEKNISYHRYTIHTFDFTALDGRERWTAYKFVKNVYEKWMPSHLERICSAVDQIPPLDFTVPGSQSDQRVEPEQEPPTQSSPTSELAAHETGALRSKGGSEVTTPDTSVSASGRRSNRKRKARSDV